MQVLAVVDMACNVQLVDHTEVCDPQLANAMWGERTGCLETPTAGKFKQSTLVPKTSPTH